MANLPGTRIRDNGVFGNITDNPLTIGATTFNSPDLADLAVVAGDHALVTLDPLREFGDPEIVMVTAHTAAATVATIQRGMFGTVARQHPVNTLWVHAATNDDFIRIVTSSTRPADPFRGQGIYETDTDRFVARNVSDVWQQEGLFFDPPACNVFHNVDQSIPHNVMTTIAFNSERYDTDTMHDTVVQNSRITITTAGIYEVNLNVGIPTTNDITLFVIVIRRDGSTDIAKQLLGTNTQIAENLGLNLSIYRKFSAGQFIEARIRHINVGSAAKNAFGNEALTFAATWIGRGN